MKIKDLLNVEKAISVKEFELEEVKKELEKLREEAEKLKLIADINNNNCKDEDLIDIKNMYLFKENSSSIIHFVRKVKCDHLNYKLVDIYTNKTLARLDCFRFIDAMHGVHKFYYCRAINETFPETKIYLDGRVPKVLIQKLYYEANGIDNKVLKMGIMKYNC